VLYTDKSKDYIGEDEWVRLVRSVAAEDELALYDLYQRTHRLVFTLCVRVTRDRETAEDLTIDVLHQVWRRAALYNPADGTVLGWIMNLARSRALERVSFEPRQKSVDPNPGTAPTETPSPDLEEALQVREPAARVREALAALTPDERQAIETSACSCALRRARTIPRTLTQGLKNCTCFRANCG
jgi:RNA polymerase sigma-70 factor, ECF subfamily